MALTARISEVSDHILDELINATGKTKLNIIEEALKSYRFQERMKLLRKQYKQLRLDDQAWAEELEERKELDGTLLDGLEEY